MGIIIIIMVTPSIVCDTVPPCRGHVHNYVYYYTVPKGHGKHSCIGTYTHMHTQDYPVIQ